MADHVKLWRHNTKKWSIFAACKNSNGKEHQRRPQLGKIISKTFFGLVIILVMAELESLLQRNGLKRLLKLNVLAKEY